MKPVCIIGAGAWGTAMATVVAHNNIPVYLWCYEIEVAQEIMQSHTNSRYLPGVHLSKLIQPVTVFDKPLYACEWIFYVTPVSFLKEITEQLKSYLKPEHKFLVFSKGVDVSSFLFPTQLINEIIGDRKAVGCLMGPSFACDVACQTITGIVAGCQDQEVFHHIKRLLENNYFRIYFSHDVIGVQIAAALKNVVALAYGILCGAHYSESTRALYITEILHDIGQFMEFMQADRKTLFGLAGIGDIILTSFGTRSKNLAFGKMLGQGFTFVKAHEQLGSIPEGINTTQALRSFLSESYLNLTLLDRTINLILGELTPEQFLTYL